MSTPTEKLVFESESCHLARVREQVREFLSTAGLDAMTSEMCVLALDEACTNIIRHAYHHTEGKKVRLTMQVVAGKVRFTLRDYGTSCDPAKIRSRDLEKIRPGGVGVHIIKQVFDHVCYEPQARGTRLILEKNLPSHADRPE